MKIVFRSANDGRAVTESRRTALTCDPELDRAVQSQANDADINVLMRRYGLTIDTPPDPSVWQNVGDFSNVGDLHQMQQHVLESKWAFQALPSRIRERFDNEVANLLDFIEDPKNAVEAAELGLLTPEAKARILKPKEKPPEEAPKPAPKGAAASDGASAPAEKNKSPG